MKSFLDRILVFSIIAICLPFAGCAGVDWTTVGTSLIADVQSGLVATTEAYAAYQAVEQQLTTENVLSGKLDVNKVLLAAQAILGKSGLASPGLSNAVQSFVADANTTIQNLKGSSAKAIITAVSDQGAGTVTTIAALPPTPAS